MSLGYMMSQRVTVLQTVDAQDEYGNQRPDWSKATSHTYPARITPITSAGGQREIERDRSTMIAMWKLYLPADADISGRDRVTYKGETFEVVGPPATLETPRGPHHIYAELRHVDG